MEREEEGSAMSREEASPVIKEVLQASQRKQEIDDLKEALMKIAKRVNVPKKKKWQMIAFTVYEHATWYGYWPVEEGSATSTILEHLKHN